MYRSDAWIRWKLQPLLAAGADPEPLVQWIHFARTQAPVLFVGAGMSLNSIPTTQAKMKTWSALVADLESDLPKHDATGSDPLWTAERYRASLGPASLYRKICEAVPDKLVGPGAAHEALTTIEWGTILTLNFDTLLERAFVSANSSRQPISISEESQLSLATRTTTLPIIHLHGHIDRPDSIVFALDDFRKYPETHSAFVAVTRQLLLQHPVLFLGFGATDPNFIAWSGWIKDRIGSHMPPWVRLDFSRDVAPRQDRGFDAYWGSMLRSVPYRDKKLADTLKALGDGLRPLVPREEYAYAREVAGMWTSAANSGGVGNGANHSLERIMDEIDKLVLSRQKRLLDGRGFGVSVQLALQHLVADAEPNFEQMYEATSEQSDEFERLFGRALGSRGLGTMVHDGSHTGASSDVPNRSFLTRKLQKEWIVSKVGIKRFAKWLTTAYSQYGNSIPIYYEGNGSCRQPTDARFDVAEEVSRLRMQASADPEMQTQLAELDRRIAEATLSSGAGNDDLKGNSPVEALEAASSARDLRRVGYYCVLAKNWKLAAEAYQRSIPASLREGEEPWVRYFTLTGLRLIQASNAKGLAYDDDEGLEMKISDAHAESHGALLSFQYDATDSARYWLKELRLALDGVRSGGGPNRRIQVREEPLERLVRRFQVEWFHPAIVGKHASELAQGYWDQGDQVAAASLWIKYGSEALAARLDSLVCGRRDEPVHGDLVAVIVSKVSGNDEGERARLLALYELSSEIDVSRLIATADGIDAGDGSSSRAQAAASHWSGRRFVPDSASANALVSVVRYMRWEAAESYFLKLSKSDADAIRWGQLPYRRWASEKSCGPKDIRLWVDNLRQRALKKTERVNLQTVASLLASLAEQPAIRSKLVASGAMDWIDSEGGIKTNPSNDDNEWLRTILQFRRSGPQARARRGREIASLLRELVAQHAPIEPALIHAWLDCRPVRTEAGLAIKILSSLVFESRHPFVDHAFLARACGKLVNFLVRSGAGEAIVMDRAARAIQASPWAVVEMLESARLSTVLASEIARCADRFCDSPVDAETEFDNDRAIVGLIDAAIRIGYPVPLRWVYALARLTRASSVDNATYACKVCSRYLRMVSKRGRSMGEPASAVAGALLAGSRDGRAVVVGAAVAAMNRARIEVFAERLVELKQDRRAAVVWQW